LKFRSKDFGKAVSIHDGVIPDLVVIENLWKAMFELFESASGINPIEMRRFLPFESPDLGFPENNNFDEWVALSKQVSGQ